PPSSPGRHVGRDVLRPRTPAPHKCPSAQPGRRERPKQPLPARSAHLLSIPSKVRFAPYRLPLRPLSAAGRLPPSRRQSQRQKRLVTQEQVGEFSAGEEMDV